MDYKHMQDKVITKRKLDATKIRLEIERCTTNDQDKVKELKEQMEQLEAHLNFLS